MLVIAAYVAVVSFAVMALTFVIETGRRRQRYAWLPSSHRSSTRRRRP